VLDPHIASVLQLLSSLGSTDLSKGGATAARASFELATVGMRRPETLAPVRSTEDVVLPHGRAGRIYRPESDGPVPTILFFHGGGFVLGSIETHDDQARLLCRDVGAVVVSVDYALAPEEPFPAGFEDCLAATQWAGEHLATLGGDSRLVVAGDSAGGNLAAAVAIACRETGPALAAQLLIYPSVDFDEAGAYPSRFANGEGYFLTATDMAWFGEQLMPPGTDRSDPRASVIHADLTGLPPAVVVTAEYDPLRDEGEAFAKALEAAGVPVVLRRADGMIHGFFGLGVISPGAAAATRQVCDDLRALLG
jgi:acetyl esterase